MNSYYKLIKNEEAPFENSLPKLGPGAGLVTFPSFFLASKAPPWTRRPRLRLGLKTFKLLGTLFLGEIPIVFFRTPIKKN